MAAGVYPGLRAGAAMTLVGVVILGGASRQQSLPNGGNYGPDQRGKAWACRVLSKVNFNTGLPSVEQSKLQHRLAEC